MLVDAHAAGANETEAKKEDIRYYAPVVDLMFAGMSVGYECYFIPCPSGLRPDSYDPVRFFLETFVVSFVQRFHCFHESFIQLSQAKDKTGVRLFSENARSWIPEMGLGVWTNRPAPRMFKEEDLKDFDPEKPMPRVLYQLHRVTAQRNARLDSMRVMAGSGCGLQLLTRIDSEKLMPSLKRLFLEQIEDRVFRIFPWYIPLIDKSAMAEPVTQLTVDALQGIPLYIRESPADEGILILSSEPLGAVLQELGLQQVETGLLPKWKLRMFERELPKK